MKLFSLVSLIALPTVVSALPTTEGIPSLSEYVTSNAISGSIQPRGIAGVSLCTSPDFPSNCTDYAVQLESCYTIPDPYISTTRSSRTSSGIVCFMFVNDDCSSCETCINTIGWTSMEFAPVKSLRCSVADALGCSNSNCRHR
ncbi:hypothetical protein AMATHDRAFT_71073 [Amanita thiersii Skay4041]|uniref:Uncharacterized protein n=1 Tax=Amanita thiersii Skay4041 TaxID=703135 RepID=A0A2A9N809_9AGAR|nr:hypothetical protein AMATHDRAFT_71073 [Amanita thiersii Skay4041]